VILVDTSIWIDHLHQGNPAMFSLLAEGEVLLHPFVRQEICLGSLRDRGTVGEFLERLPEAPLASTDDVLVLIESHKLFATGIGLTDVHLVASALLSDETLIWTRDRRLDAVATRLSISATG
jgi:predicted nucleic acid-binding protein